MKTHIEMMLRVPENISAEIERCKANQWALLGILNFLPERDNKWEVFKAMDVNHELFYIAACHMRFQSVDRSKEIYRAMATWVTSKERKKRAFDVLDGRDGPEAIERLRNKDVTDEAVKPINIREELDNNTDEPWAWYAIITQGKHWGKSWIGSGLHRLSKEEIAEAYAFLQQESKLRDMLSVYAMRSIVEACRSDEGCVFPGILKWIKKWGQADIEYRFGTCQSLSYTVIEHVDVPLTEYSYGNNNVDLVFDLVEHGLDWRRWYTNRKNFGALFFRDFCIHGYAERLEDVLYPHDPSIRLESLLPPVRQLLDREHLLYPGNEGIQLYALSWAYFDVLKGKLEPRRGESKDDYLLRIASMTVSWIIQAKQQYEPDIKDVFRVGVLLYYLPSWTKNALKRHYHVMVALASVRTLPRLTAVKRVPLERLPPEIIRALGGYFASVADKD